MIHFRNYKSLFSYLISFTRNFLFKEAYKLGKILKCVAPVKIFFETELKIIILINTVQNINIYIQKSIRLAHKRQ